MDIAQDIKDRITVAANALYEELGRSEFPTVAAVRSRAATDMNAASIVMRQWRRAQTTQSAPWPSTSPTRCATWARPGKWREPAPLLALRRFSLQSSA